MPKLDMVSWCQWVVSGGGGGVSGAAGLTQKTHYINDIFESMDNDFVPSGTIVARLEEREDRLWGTWSYGQPMTKHALARRLKNYGIAPSKKREGQHTVRGYYRDDNFKEKLKRYCQVDVEPTQMTQPSV